jgi:hypothetical protein
MQLRWHIFVEASRRRRIDRRSFAVSILGCLIVAGVLIGSAAKSQIGAQELTLPDRQIEQRALETVHSMYGGTSEVRIYLPLTEPFNATSKWELVAKKETDLKGNDEIIDPNPVTICFVRHTYQQCALWLLRDRVSARCGSPLCSNPSLS